MKNEKLRAAIVGAGYISDFHVTAIERNNNCSLVAVCDLNPQSAARFSGRIRDAGIYTDLDKMLESERPDVVHILSQPDSHHHLASTALRTGCHVILEKPFVTSEQEARSLLEIANQNNAKVAVNHNFVFSRPFNQLKKVLTSKTLGPIKSVSIVWRKVLAPTSFGPWDLWMLREPGNIILETGSHSLAELLSVTDNPTIDSVDVLKKKRLPSGVDFYLQWNIRGRSKSTIFDIQCSFDQGYEQHSVTVEGLFGVACADIENDVFELRRNTGHEYDIERLSVNLRRGLSVATQSIQGFGSYCLSKFSQKSLGGAYEASMLNGIESCYLEIDQNATRKETSGEFAMQVSQLAEQVWRKLPDEYPPISNQPIKVAEATKGPKKKADILVIGASGFIGKRLFLDLQKRGIAVRALVRNASRFANVELSDKSELMLGDYRDSDTMNIALDGIKTVFHLAQSHSNSLSGYLKNNHDPTLELAEACKRHGVNRFIYTGTIDSLYLGKSAGTVVDSTSTDPEIKRRNNYAHSKATTEASLREMHETSGFPVVIIRPAIVLGVGGPVNHVGVAQWQGIGRCRYWGDGMNKLPLVLVDDVVTGLSNAAFAEDIEGNTYNLSAPSSISAVEYVKEVENAIDSNIETANSKAAVHWFFDSVKWVFKVLARHPDRDRVPSLRDWQCREQHARFDTSKAEKDLQWQPVSDRQLIIKAGIHEPAVDSINS